MSLSDNAARRLEYAMGNGDAAREMVSAINTGAGSAATSATAAAASATAAASSATAAAASAAVFTKATVITATGATTAITTVPGSFAALADVQAYLAGANMVPNIQTRLANLEAKVDAVIAALKVAGLMAVS